MSTVGQPESATQSRVLALFRDELGYRALGDWTDRAGNSNVEEGLLSAWLGKASYSPDQIGRAIYLLRTEADNPNNRGGIIWHTQGSGKSIVMVMLAKWILENRPSARVAIVTDRDELDKQIEGVFTEAGEPIKRTSSGRDLMSQLGQATPRLLCSLVHKFGQRSVNNGVDDFDAFIKELAAQPSPTVGELFVFVDECHRTQSGKLHKTMKA